MPLIPSQHQANSILNKIAKVASAWHQQSLFRLYSWPEQHGKRSCDQRHGGTVKIGGGKGHGVCLNLVYEHVLNKNPPGTAWEV
jgi:hypothetical protein